MSEGMSATETQWRPGEVFHAGRAWVKFTHAGPQLFIGLVEVRTWLGCDHDMEAVALASRIDLQLSIEFKPA
jgi:hypothetical protein